MRNSSVCKAVKPFANLCKLNLEQALDEYLPGLFPRLASVALSNLYLGFQVHRAGG